MENNLKLCPDKFCRTCLTENSDMKSLTATIVGPTRSLLDVLNFVADINVFVDNPLPKRICSNCESILVTADAFKQRCLQSEAILTQQFETSTYRQIGDNIPNTTLVKDENGLQIGVLDPNAQAAGSKSTLKSSDGSFNEIFETFSHSVVKVKELSGSSPSKPINELFDDKKDILDKPNVVQIVKEENNIDFNTQNDDSFDFGVTVTYEPESIKLKKEKASFKEVRIFSCSCGTVFNTKNDYRLHLHARNCNGYKKSTKIKVAAKDPDFNEKSNKKKPVVCPLCNAEFSTVKARKIHQKSHNKSNEDSGNFECTICMRKFNRKSSWTNHIKHHDMKSGIKFTCETCKREFQHKAHLDNHILAVHSREKGYTCDICSTNFATLDSLEIHKDSHKIEKKHRCKICNKAFYMLSSLNDHLRVHTGEKPYLCSICGRGFSQKTNLAQHVRRHQGLKPFKCEHCDRRFVSKGELVAHTRKHSGAHPFVCDDCGSGFTTSSSLVKHRRVHTGERPYACDLCPRKFAASGTLKNHRRTHTGEKPFQCSYCEKAFVQRQDLVSHIRGHTGERPYTCGCGQAFRKASSLKAHVRLHGKEPQRDLSLLLQPAAILTDLNTSLAPSNV